MEEQESMQRRFEQVPRGWMPWVGRARGHLGPKRKFTEAEYNHLVDQFVAGVKPEEAALDPKG